MKAIFSTLTLAAVLVLAACGGGSKSLEAKKEKLENELIENSRKSLELAEANNKLTLSNKKIAKNTFIATIIGIIITILTSSSISKLSCNTINVGTKPPITDTVKDKQNN